MRLSTFQIHQQASQQLQSLGSQAAQTQEQISHGKRIVRPSDDPVGAARVVSIDQALVEREQFVQNIAAVDAQLAQEDTVLGQVVDIIHRVQELAIAAGSGVRTPEDQQLIATEIEARYGELMAMANTQTPAGQYLFSGFKGAVKPFQEATHGVSYQGDNGQRFVQIGRNQMVASNDTGSDVFMNVAAAAVRAEIMSVHSADVDTAEVKIVDQAAVNEFYPHQVVVEFDDSGSGLTFTARREADGRLLPGLENIPYTPGAPIKLDGMEVTLQGIPASGDVVVVGTTQRTSVFDIVKNLTRGLQDGDALGTDAVQGILDTAVKELSNALESVSLTRSKLGVRFSDLDTAQNLHEDFSLQLNSMKSAIKDLDFAEAVSDLAYQSFVLEAAQQSFVRINGLSLFNRL